MHAMKHKYVDACHNRYNTDYDVIVLGAGPARSTTAATVAAAGYCVLMLEKNT